MNRFFKVIAVGIAAIILIAVLRMFFLNPSKTVEFVSADMAVINVRVVTVNQNMAYYDRGFMVVNDGKIADIGAGDLPEKYLAKKILDGKGKVLMPGLVNTHAHAAMSLLNGLGQSLPLAAWLKAMAPYEQQLTPEDVYWGSLLAETQMLKTGTTAMNDMYFFPESTAEASAETGIRSILRLPLNFNEGNLTVDANLFSLFATSSSISFSVAPNPLYNYSVGQLKQISDFALASSSLIHIHFEEDESARKEAMLKYSLTPVELITQVGFLRNKIVLAHAADLTKEEIYILSRSPGVGASFNPVSESNLYTPFTPVKLMLEQGLPVALGSDGEPSGDLNLFVQAKAVVTGGQADAQTALKMATINGAKVLGLESKTGSLEIGKLADFILVDIPKTDDIYKTLVYNMKEGSVTDVAVGGALKIENGQFLNLNLAEIKNKAAQIRARLGLHD